MLARLLQYVFDSVAVPPASEKYLIHEVPARVLKQGVDCAYHIATFRLRAITLSREFDEALEVYRVARLPSVNPGGQPQIKVCTSSSMKAVPCVYCTADRSTPTIRFTYYHKRPSAAQLLQLRHGLLTSRLLLVFIH